MLVVCLIPVQTQSSRRESCGRGLRKQRASPQRKMSLYKTDTVEDTAALVTLWAGQACGLHVNFALIFSFCDYSFTFFLKTLLDQIYEIHTMEKHAGHTDLPLACRLLLPFTGPPSSSSGRYRSECVYTGPPSLSLGHYRNECVYTGPPSPSPGHYRSECVFTGPPSPSPGHYRSECVYIGPPSPSLGIIEVNVSIQLKVKVKSLSRVPLFAVPWTVAHQASPSMGFSRQEYWSGLPFPSPGYLFCKCVPGIVIHSPFLPPNKKNYCFQTRLLEKTLESPLESKNSILKEINPGYSLEGLMLKLKL